MKSKTEIIKEIKKNFENNPRSINPETGACYYNGPNGEHCAFAVCVKEEFLPKLTEYERKQAFMVIHDLSINILKEEYQIKDTDFWRGIQEFHDDNDYWEETENGNILTEEGEEFYHFLLEEYSDQ